MKTPVNHYGSQDIPSSHVRRVTGRPSPRTPAESNVVKASDFLLLHFNGPDDPDRVRNMIGTSRKADGYQYPPVNWGINAERKKQFFTKLQEVIGA